MTTISPKPFELPPKHFSEAPGARLPTEISMTTEECLLPTDRYLRRDVYDREVTDLWSRVWQVACRVDDLAQPGAYAEYTTADQSFLLVRGRDDQIRAFHNVCRRRGTQLKCGRGKVREIRCPFHSWTWSLEGILDHVPDEDSFTALDLTQYGLFEVRTGCWAGFVFLNPDDASARALPLEEFLAPVNEHLEGYHLEKMVALSDVSAPVAANWKTLTEAFLESYHPQAVHPQILPSTDDKNTVYELLGRHSRMLSRMGVPSPRLGSDLNLLESIAYLPNLFGGPSAREFDPTYTSSSLRHLVDPYENADGNIELPSGAKVPDLVATLLAPYLDEAGRLALPPDWTGRDVLIEMIGAFVADAGYLRLPVAVSPRDLFIDMTSAVAVAKGRDYRALSRDQVLDDWHYFIFPNLVLNIQAGGFLFTRFRPDASHHERSWFDAIRFVWPSEGERDSIRPAPHVEVAEDERDVFGPVLSQDLEFIPRIQRGMHSRALRVISVGQQETRIPQFHKTIDSYLEGGVGARELAEQQVVKIGFAGLGNMGSIMAGHLVDAGHTVTAFNRSPERARRFAEETGAEFGPTPAAIVEEADLVLGMLFDEQAVRDVYGGPQGILSALQPGQIVAEMGTVGIPAIEWLTNMVAPTGAAVLDAPVSGSMATAREVQLLIMVGGEPAAVEQARPALDAMGKAVVHLGPVGAGTRMKLALNSVVYALNQALAESLLLAERNGIDRSTAYDVFANSVVASPAVHYRRPVFEQPGGPVQSLSIQGAEKDLRLALALADEVRLPMGQARYNASVLAEALAGGFAGRDVGEVAEYLRTTLGYGRPVAGADDA